MKSKAFTLGRTKPRQFAGLGYDGGKPCPTCYHPMDKTGGSTWACAKHGEPTRP